MIWSRELCQQLVTLRLHGEEHLHTDVSLSRRLQSKGNTRTWQGKSELLTEFIACAHSLCLPASQSARAFAMAFDNTSVMKHVLLSTHRPRQAFDHCKVCSAAIVFDPPHCAQPPYRWSIDSANCRHETCCRPSPSLSDKQTLQGRLNSLSWCRRT